MKQKALVILLFSIWLLVASVIVFFSGGLTGKFGVNNIFIFTSTILISLVLFISSIQMVQGKKSGYYVAVVILTLFTVNFAIRFYITRVIAPPGVGLFLTITILLYILFGEGDKKVSKK